MLRAVWCLGGDERGLDRRQHRRLAIVHLGKDRHPVGQCCWRTQPTRHIEPWSGCAAVAITEEIVRTSRDVIGHER